MLQIHEQIASDQYWTDPAAPDMQGLPFLTNTWDVFRSEAVLHGIDRACREIAERGAQTCPVEYGQGVELISTPGGVLKVVEDMRVHRKKETRGRQYDTPELFDARAQAMVGELLYAGPQTGLRLDVETSAIDIARRTVYLQNGASGKQLVGKTSDLLGKGGSQYSSVFMRNGIPVGHVRSYESRRDSVQRRIVSAEVITPSGLKRAKSKIIDLGAIGVSLSPAALHGFA